MFHTISKQSLATLLCVFLFTITGKSAAFTEDELLNEIHKTVLNLNKEKVSDLVKNRKTKTTFSFVNKENSLKITAQYSSSFFNPVWGWGALQKPVDQTDFSYKKFNILNGTLKLKYHYVNSLRQRTLMTLTFKCDLIKEIKNHENDLEIVEGLPLESNDDSLEEPLEQKQLQDEEVEAIFYDAFPSENSKGESEPVFYDFPVPDSGIQILIKSTIKKLSFVRKLSSTILLAADQSDHIWTTASAGSAAAVSFWDACTNMNVLSGIYAVGYTVVACKSANRIYDSIYKKYSSEAEKLLLNIEESSRQIEAFSDSQQLLLQTIGDSLSSNEKSIDSILKKQEKITQLLEEKSLEKRSSLQEILSLYTTAQHHAQTAKENFDSFQIEVEKIRSGWNEINAVFYTLKSTAIELGEPNDKKESAKQEFLKTLASLVTQIDRIQDILSSLQEPMEKQASLSIVVNTHRSLQDELLSQAEDLMLSIIAEEEATNRELIRMLNEAQHELTLAKETIKKQGYEIAECKKQSEEMRKLAKQSQKDSREAREQVQSMYTKRDIIIGATVAVLCPGGTLISVIAGVGALQASKTFSSTAE